MFPSHWSVLNDPPRTPARLIFKKWRHPGQPSPPRAPPHPQPPREPLPAAQWPCRTPVGANVGHTPLVLGALKSEFLTLTAQWNRPGSFEKHQPLGPMPRDSDLIGLGGGLALKLLKILR